MLLNQETLATPIGEFQLLTDSKGRVVALEWTDLTERYEKLLKRQYPGVVFQIQPADHETDACRSLKNYFNGDLNALAEIRVHHGGTEFQREVWSALREIPVGETVSYGVLADRIGRPAAVRAVGLANGANPIGIVTPCHRVIGKDGTLTGYGGGLERKRWLLMHEGALTPQMV